MRREIVIGVVILAVLLLFLLRGVASRREAFLDNLLKLGKQGAGGGTTLLAEQAIKYGEASNLSQTKQAQGLLTRVQKAEATGNATDALKALDDMPDNELKQSLKRNLELLKPGKSAADTTKTMEKLNLYLQALARKVQSNTKQLRTSYTNWLKTTPDDIQKILNSPDNLVTRDQRKRIGAFLKDRTQAELSKISAFAKNPYAKDLSATLFAKNVGIDIKRPSNAVKLSPGEYVKAVRNLEATQLRNAENGVPANANEALENAFYINILQNLTKDQKIGYAIGAFGIVAAVVGTVVGIVVKPPYWNDPGVLDGTGGATPGQQPFVDFINWSNENPAAITMSSCMSCICCCCCCVLLILAMSGGGKKNNNFTL